MEAARSSETSGSSYTPTRNQNPKAYNLSRPTFVRFAITEMYFTILVYRMYSTFVNSTFVQMNIKLSEEAKWRWQTMKLVLLLIGTRVPNRLVCAGNGIGGKFQALETASTDI